jgi:hypothetical protein
LADRQTGFPEHWPSDSPGAERQLMAVEVQRGPDFRAVNSQPLLKLNAGKIFDVAPDVNAFL